MMASSVLVRMLFVQLFVFLPPFATCLFVCNRIPDGVIGQKSLMTDNRYIIDISGNPETYVPGEQYKIHLKSNPEFPMKHSFKDFMLLVEHESSERTIAERGNPTVGNLQLFGDMLTKFSTKCKNAVVATNTQLSKTDVQVLWTAPQTGSGCVAIRATVVESRDQWYSDDGPLSVVLCEEMLDNEEIQPNIQNYCCACDEAKYEVTFEGMWSRNTHPKDFPQNNWLTKFSDIIGASHSINYTFWNYGDIASNGLKELAESGNTRELESELKSKSEHIRTIIKARGITYPNITGKTFAVFRVDNKHHLMSLVSMISPSPDWIVGVSSYELCLRNCSWVESRTLKLYPYDAGTDDGITYLSDNKPSYPRQPIRRIKSNSPNDPNSPFYDPTGAEIPPLAKLHLTRQRLYEKACEPPLVDLGESDENCDTEEWSAWSDCSQTCGKGVKYRQRAYRDPKTPKNNCKKVLTHRSNCYGAQKHCRLQNNQKPIDPECELTEWGSWSSCSATCGPGIKTRSRRYKNRSAAKKCPTMTENPPKLEENLMCFESNCPEEDMEEMENCNIPWSEWSACSATCGKGVKTRYRYTSIPHVQNRREGGISYRFKQRNNAYSTKQEEDEDEPDSEEDTSNPIDAYSYFHGSPDQKCNKVKETVECINDDFPTCNEGEKDASACTLPKDTGICKGNMDRWYFDNIKGRCEIFSYSGCHGNPNNFRTLEQCQIICNNYQNSNFPALSQIKHSPVGPVINCQVSKWTHWSECQPQQGNCGKGMKSKNRHIITHEMNGGKKCPKKLIKRRRCQIPCENPHSGNDPYHEMPHQFSQEDSEELYPEWGPPYQKPTAPPKVDCLLSPWTKWSPCSVSCGLKALQTKTRSILRHPSGGGMPCGPRVARRPCNLLACPE